MSRGREPSYLSAARRAGLRFLGVEGTTGTQASFMDLFHGDEEKVRELDRRVSAAFGFERPWLVTGQTYSRKVDAAVLATLSGVAQSAHKFANDVRLLMAMKEIDEPSEKAQIGSSAMAYKQNPMRCERMTALVRHVMAVAGSAVGLGNFLRFPGNAAANGGGAFMLPYFVSLLVLGIPLCWAEWTMGRYAGMRGFNSAPGVFTIIWKHPAAKYVGGLALLRRRRA